MARELFVYNTLTRKKELFEPLRPPLVGMYVCGPTVYGDPHLGHARQAISFDLIYRYLLNIGYKVRYVRNVTDVGHLENDADEGEDKIARKARLEQLEPMEVAQYYYNRYQQAMQALNVMPPSIEPRASGHIIEQQQFVREILKKDLAYESNGSVYFDVEAYNKYGQYGKLSGRVLEDLKSNTRQLDGQKEKKNQFDFALWKKAEPQHIMRWPSEWSDGFPGWHLECSAMSTKYLGIPFDIHGGGMDLLFPHHECEIAQNVAALGEEAVKYWLHNNMITINGQKMGKSLGNVITLNELFSGDHPVLEKAYNPMTIRFFILQAHYGSTLDFSNDALQASEKGFQRLVTARETLDKLVPEKKSSLNDEIQEIKEKCYNALNDDFNSPILISNLFEVVRIINLVKEGKETATLHDLELIKEVFNTFAENILGLKFEKVSAGNEELVSGLVELLLELRIKARKNKDFGTSDKIRDELGRMGVEVRDRKEGTDWNIKQE